MKRLLLCLSLLAPPGLLACGSSPCRRVQEASRGAEGKVERCDTESKVLVATLQRSDADVDMCEQDVDACSEADREALDTATRCIDGLEACVEGGEERFRASALGCIAPLTAISPGCQAAFRIESGE